jgi:hypothetical protein
MNRTHGAVFFHAFLALGIGACSSTDEGSPAGGGAKGGVQIFVEPEESIPEGLKPGTDTENVQDGWTVTYSKYLVTIGNFRASRSDGSGHLSDPSIYVLDLKNAPAGGYVMTTWNDVDAVRWDKLGWDLPNAKAGVKTLAPTSEADVTFMVENGYSLYFEGKIEKTDGQSCTPGASPPACVPAPSVAFRWGFAAGTAFDDCANEEGVPGFAVPAGGTAQLKPTVHGDHWFFDNLTSGAEITKRFAQWMADCDLDHDGETTLDELQTVKAADAFPMPPYNLSGTLTPIETAYDYALNQSRTLGDYNGDGECPTRKVLP